MEKDILEESESKIRIPLTIGICGHREFATSENEVREELVRIWSFLRQKFPNTPFIVLDSLAEGADRIVLKYLPPDVPYVAVLPFAAERFKEDFADDRSRTEFGELLGGAARVIVAGERVRDYSAAARYVLKHSDLLLALWDMDFDLRDRRRGDVPPPGGTWDSVNLALASATTGFPDERHPVEVMHLPIRRRNDAPSSSAEPTHFRILKPGEGSVPEAIPPEDWTPSEDLILSDQLNRKCRGSVQNLSRMSEFTGGVDVKEIHADIARYSFFSDMAKKVRRRQKREFSMIFSAAVILGVAILLCQRFIEPLQKIPLRPYVVFLACTWIYFKLYLAKLEHSDWHLLSRSITEGLRIEIFWRLWGLPDSVAASFPDDTRFLIRIFRNWELLSAPPPSCMKAHVLKCWIEGQRNWLGQRIAAARRKDRFCKAAQWGVLVAALVLAGVCLIQHWHPLNHFSGSVQWNEIAGVVLGCGMLLFSCIAFFRQKKAWLRLADVYSVSYRNYDHVVRNYERFSPEERDEAVRKLGIRALRENSKWRGIRRDLRK